MIIKWYWTKGENVWHAHWFVPQPYEKTAWVWSVWRWINQHQPRPTETL